ncbi:MAG: HAH_0734 family protein [Haloglomus sp.]
MKRLIIHGDPGIRKDAIIQVDGEELVCFAVARQGDWHGPDRVQLWCTVGTEGEYETFQRRDFIPMHLDVEAVDADAVEVIKAKGDLAV